MNLENFEKHLLFDKLKQFSEVITDEKTIEKVDIENLSFYQSVLNYISQRIKLTLPDLVQQSEMDAVSKEISEGVTQINNFLGNNNVGHLSNAKNNFNSTLIRISDFPIPSSRNDFNFSKEIANFESTVIKKFKSLEKEKLIIENTLTEFQTDLNNNNKEIKRLIKLLEEKETEIKNINSNFQTEFNNIKTNQIQSFEEDKKEYHKEINNTKDLFKKEIDELKIEINTDTSDLVNQLIKKLEEAKKIVNVIGNVGVTGNYQIIANEHKKTANFWRGMAITFMIIFSGLLVWTIIDLSADGFNWTKSLIRLIAAAALSYPATYAARESSKHRRLETINRNAELELASINPFIENLSEVRKQAIKESLVEKYFGNNRNSQDEKPKENEELTIGSFEKIINAISKLKI